ncbi:DUF7657 domain-containing protein [Spirosoma utsteinense]|uniref:Glycosyltransferase RgtA/B/C/D-like domain-containing protein n=1 Tax=Spirosoma utsteinense TaxID=2585773 RepID=A0ABR6W0H4_9BACT|nr:hypothetical protein [Spirosoma utsteinense]MBC3783782.1 hypothetical protein [Spirosoma utsteinense]MBC3790074.1 hypothetical protein [Spirosoma utsteinense]
MNTKLPTRSGFELIHFDKKLKWFIGICFGLFLIVTLAKIHPISLAMWNELLPDGSNPKRGLISGQPRRIRMDDYAVGTPWILSQANKGFPTINETIGGENTPILVTPTHHFSEIFRPDHWGFFFLPIEQAYAWLYNLRAFMSIVGAVLMLLLLTRNNFWLSIVGSIWLFYSSGTVSWSFIPAPLIAATSLIFVATVYLLYGKSPKQVLGASLALAWLLMVYALILYPPYQVPLGYVLLFLLIGYFINNWDVKRLFSDWPVKLGGGILSLVILGVAFWLFYIDVKPTLDAIMNTVYPGKRSELGGTGFVANWFSEYFRWQVDDTRFPSGWLNHCELSHYVTFAPIIIPCAITAFAINRKIDWTVLLLSVFVIVGYVWIEVGFPEWLAKMTLLNMSPTRRTQIPFGIGNVLLTILYLHYLTTIEIKSNKLYTGIGLAVVLGFMIYAANLNVEDSAGFFKLNQLFMPILFFTGLGSLLLFTWQPAYRNVLFGVGILLFQLPNLKLNPVSKGMTPITEHALYVAVQNIHNQEPAAKWAVFGSQFVSYMVTATGVDLLSGVKYVPPRNTFKVLDPAMKRDSAYNRYAHTVYNSYIDGKDSVIVQNTYEDAYVVAMDPCSPRFKKLNVKYIVFDKQPQPVETRCMKLVTTLGTIQIYRIND